MIVGNSSNISNDFDVYDIGGTEYIRGKDINDKYQFSASKIISDNQILNLVDENNKIIIEEVSYTVNNGVTYIAKDYFVNVIQPLIE